MADLIDNKNSMTQYAERTILIPETDQSEQKYQTQFFYTHQPQVVKEKNDHFIYLIIGHILTVIVAFFCIVLLAFKSSERHPNYHSPVQQQPMSQKMMPPIKTEKQNTIDIKKIIKKRQWKILGDLINQKDNDTFSQNIAKMLMPNESEALLVYLNQEHRQFFKQKKKPLSENHELIPVWDETKQRWSVKGVAPDQTS